MSQLITGSGSPCRVRFSRESLLQWRLDPSNQSFTRGRGRARGSSQSRVLWVQNARTGRAGKNAGEEVGKNPWIRIHGEESGIFITYTWMVHFYGICMANFSKTWNQIQDKSGVPEPGIMKWHPFFWGVDQPWCKNMVILWVIFLQKIDLSRWWFLHEFLMFTPKLGVSWSNLTVADFSDELVQPAGRNLFVHPI